MAFEKYDGTNLHWDWDPELGWHAFGARRTTFDLDAEGIGEFCRGHPGLEEAPRLFLDTLAEPLGRIFKDKERYRSSEVRAFTEFLGAGSFAGKHRADDRKRLVLFDVMTAAGFVDPETFLADFSELPIARVVYRGRLTGKFINDVREGKYGVTEGVVCKGRSGEEIWRIKIKTFAYQRRLREAFADQWETYWE